MTAIRTYHPVAGVQSAQGLDVSSYQGRFNWAGTSGLSFGINRVTQGLGGPAANSPDPEARWNHAAIRDAGLARGCYHFLDPRLDGAAQARYMVDTLGTYGIVSSDMLFCDNETPGTGPAATAACAQAFMNELRRLRPHNPLGVYSNLSFDWNGYDAGLGHWPAWLAWPASSAPVPAPTWSRWAFWQWGLRNGIDADAFNGTVADLDAWIASFLPPPPPPAGPPYRFVTSAGDTIASLAASRNATTEHFLARCAQNYQPADLATLAAAKLPAGLPYYTSNP